MDHFHERDGALWCEDVPLARIADEVGTPVYVYSAATFRRHARVFRDGLAGAGDVHLAYAIKANPNIAVLRLLAAEGYGADVVSGGEMSRALAAGMPADGIVFSGVGKTVAEVERDLIIDTLSHCLGNRTHAANILGISIRTLRNKLKQYSDEGVPVPPAGGEAA